MYMCLLFSKLSNTITIMFQFLGPVDRFRALHYCEKARNVSASGTFSVSYRNKFSLPFFSPLETPALRSTPNSSHWFKSQDLEMLCQVRLD